MMCSGEKIGPKCFETSYHRFFEGSFHSLFEAGATRDRLIVTFLAILEMTRLKMLKITQSERGGELYLTPSFESAEVEDLSGKVTRQ